jgi:hypothetical protein
MPPNCAFPGPCYDCAYASQFRRSGALLVACPKGRGHPPALTAARGRGLGGRGAQRRPPGGADSGWGPASAAGFGAWHRVRPRRRHQAPPPPPRCPHFFYRRWQRGPSGPLAGPKPDRATAHWQAGMALPDPKGTRSARALAAPSPAPTDRPGGARRRDAPSTSPRSARCAGMNEFAHSLPGRLLPVPVLSFHWQPSGQGHEPSNCWLLIYLCTESFNWHAHRTLPTNPHWAHPCHMHHHPPHLRGG